MELHYIEVYTSEKESYQLTVHYYPSVLVRNATYWEPEEWSDITIEGIYRDDVALTEDELDVFPFYDEEWITVTEHKLY